MNVKKGALEVTGGKEYDVLSVRDVPNFYRSKIGYPVNDLKIVETSNVDTSLGQKAVSINSNPDLPDNSVPVYVSGYGQISEGGEAANHLRTAEVPIVSFAQCRSRYVDLQRAANICAGTGEMDSCKGDSGGALWSFTPKSQSTNSSSASPITVYGVVSYGEGCANPFAPGVYTRISTYYDWIQDQIKLPPTPQNQQTSPSDGSTTIKSNWFLIAVVAGGGLLFLLLFGFGCYCCYTRRVKRHQNKGSS